MSKDDKAANRQRQFIEWAKSELGQAFTNWWSEHRDSGFATKDMETRWGIRPYYAWNIWEYKAEFFAEHEDEFDRPENFPKPEFEEIRKWREDQLRVEEKTTELEREFGKEFWKRISPEQFLRGYSEKGIGKA